MKKIKKKILLLAFGISSFAIAMPITLTSCSNASTFLKDKEKFASSNDGYYRQYTFLSFYPPSKYSNYNETELKQSFGYYGSNYDIINFSNFVLFENWVRYSTVKTLDKYGNLITATVHDFNFGYLKKMYKAYLQIAIGADQKIVRFEFVELESTTNSYSYSFNWIY